jgi:hypothetical protein
MCDHLRHLGRVSATAYITLSQNLVICRTIGHNGHYRAFAARRSRRRCSWPYLHVLIAASALLDPNVGRMSDAGERAGLGCFR